MRAGVDVPEAMSKKALDSIARCRTPSGSFTYGEIWNMGPAAGINQIKGSACRTPACQLALEAFGREVPVADHRRSLEDLLIKHARMQLLSLRRPIPHDSRRCDGLAGGPLSGGYCRCRRRSDDDAG